MVSCLLFQLSAIALGLSISCQTGNAVFPTRGKGEGLQKFRFCKFINIDLINPKLLIYITMNLNTSVTTVEEVELVEFKGNNVKYIPNEIFKKFPNLAFVYVQSNTKLDVLKASYFMEAVNLKILRVMDNPFTYLESNLFAGAKNLEVINLQNNSIESIHKDAFNGLNLLKFLYLDRNQISALNLNTFSKLLKLQVLNLSFNICVQKNFANTDNSLEFAIFMKAIEDALKNRCNLENILNDINKSVDTIKALQDEVSQVKKEQQKSSKMLKILTQKENGFREYMNANVTNITDFQPQFFRYFQGEIKNVTEILDQLRKQEEKQEKLNGSIFELNFLIIFCVLIFFNTLLIMGVYLICIIRRNINVLRIRQFEEYSRFEMCKISD